MWVIIFFPCSTLYFLSFEKRIKKYTRQGTLKQKGGVSHEVMTAIAPSYYLKSTRNESKEGFKELGKCGVNITISNEIEGKIEQNESNFPK